MGLVSLTSFQTSAMTLTEREYQIKSAFIANFIRYTRWNSLPSETFDFCTTSEKANNILSLSLSDERWFDLTTNFIVIKPGEEQQCHFLFVDQISNKEWKSYLETHPVNNLLIVSEKQHAARTYSQINFFFADNKLRFEINPKRLKDANLHISVSLLRLARIVSSGSTATEEQK